MEPLLQDLSLAIDAMKDRICAIEQHTFEKETEEDSYVRFLDVEEIKSTLGEARRLVAEARSIKGNLTRTEERIQQEYKLLQEVQHDIKLSLTQLADYLDVRKKLNLRVDRVDKAIETSNQIREILIKMAREGDLDEHAN